ncbi:rod shape-determining protein MreC [Glaciimonas sp. CA11.2]|uniref:rod shape-determining protein MreC n=1 Tax=unclassified Glaciimonas TaxID=2644401 RepID=UPI002AB4B347|nr:MULTISPECIES: rod shape-determining protein MreC [unclassified Glaciimonas]MDY7546310.1 rod shape-determining protein MreC [Glaciimonas sp. CA11.2]MEB0010741.1 rod shape-determining protein MreC [Glaciimonas sp. Cout2]MEB0082123.1 rod shape-determining protein MreC [Glaciimonas sp. Gout2]MEB0162811.1 rod shape-determining protein MreC [Glaciimonas sp. CA11.2]
MEYSPPPLFKQGASARGKAIVCTLLALTLLIVDARLHALVLLRQAVSTVLYPVQAVALMPRDATYRMIDYFSTLSSVEKENRELRTVQASRAQQLQQAQLLAVENVQLRKLLGAQQQLAVKSVMSEILYDARDPFTRKVVVDRGSQQGVLTGQPVIDDAGIVGQVTRVFPFTSEITLLTDKDQAIPVQVLRNGLRSVAYGRGQSGFLDLRFMAANADVKKDDVLVTSGIDGVYPPGLTVAKVVLVENKSADAFAHIVCAPAAGIDRHRQLLILLVDPKPAPRPDDIVKPSSGKVDTLSKRRLTDSPREKAQEAANAASEADKEANKDAMKNAARDAKAELARKKLQERSR